MTITLTPMHGLIAAIAILVLAPIAYGVLRQPVGDYDLGLDAVLVAAVCWCAALGLGVGLLAGRFL